MMSPPASTFGINTESQGRSDSNNEEVKVGFSSFERKVKSSGNYTISPFRDWTNIDGEATERQAKKLIWGRQCSRMSLKQLQNRVNKLKNRNDKSSGKKNFKQFV